MRLSDYPYVLVRVGCPVCKRRGQYRLARLAYKCGPETTLDQLIDEMTKDCGWRNDRSPKKNGCRVRFIDIEGGGGPPDVPPMPLKLVMGGRGLERKQGRMGSVILTPCATDWDVLSLLRPAGFIPLAGLFLRDGCREPKHRSAGPFGCSLGPALGQASEGKAATET